MTVKVYEWGTNKHFEMRLVAVLKDVTEIKEDKYGWLISQGNEKGYHLKSQYKIVTEQGE